MPSSAASVSWHAVRPRFTPLTSRRTPSDACAVQQISTLAAQARGAATTACGAEATV